jgi:hypothetical protein
MSRTAKLADLAAAYDSGGGFGFKNRIINPAMVIDQRNAGASVTPTVDGQYGSCDRWNYWLSQVSKFSAQQSSTAPTGFANSLLITSLSAYAVTGSDYFAVNQKIEGFNFSDMMWGTASAATVTLSFWVRSSLTGTFGGAMTNNAFNRSYPFSYTVSVANTWEQKSVTITGDTTGTWVGSTNGVGAIAQFSLGAVAGKLGTANAWAGSWYVGSTGSTSVVGTNGATFYITGVQLEKGSTATSFDYRPYGIELRLCQRYYYRTVSGGTSFPLSNVGGVFSTTQARALTTFPVRMRTTPAALEQSGTASDYAILQTTAAVTCSSVPTFNAASLDSAYTDFTIASGGSTGSYAMIRGTVSTAYLGWSAEL